MSIRLRVAAVFTLALAVAFALGSWLLVSQLRGVVLRSVDAGLTLQLDRASRLLGPPRASAGSLAALPPGDYVLQLIDPAGQVRAAGPEAGRAPLLTPSQQRAARHGRIAVTTTIDGDPERLMAAPCAGKARLDCRRRRVAGGC